MIKSIFLGALFLGLAGVLIFGAVNRTIAKSTETPLAKGEGGGGQLEGSIDTDHQGGHGQFESNAAGGTHETHDHDGDCSGDLSESHEPGSELGGSCGEIRMNTSCNTQKPGQFASQFALVEIRDSGSGFPQMR